MLRRSTYDGFVTFAVRFSLAVLVLFGAVRITQARTITLTAADCEFMAVISALAPEAGWAGTRGVHYYETNAANVSQRDAIFLQFNLGMIPKNMRIIRAELSLPLRGKPKASLHLWRLLQPWGVGVSYLHRMVRPVPVPWAQPGARGAGTDRAATPSAQVQLPPERENEVVLNVLNDIELWYSGSVENYGWMISTEEPREEVQFAYPLSYPHFWKLNITYGP